MIDEFLKYLHLEKKYSSHTIKAYSSDLLSFQSFIVDFYSLKITDITHQHIRSWLVDMIKEGYSNRALCRKISVLRSFYKFLLRKSLVVIDPTLKIQAPKQKKSVPHTIDQQVLLANLDFRDARTFAEIRDLFVIIALYTTGMRRSELIYLKHTDVDIARSVIRVLGKGNKERFIPITGTFLDAYRKHKEASEKFFDNYSSFEFIVLTERGMQAYPKLIYNIVTRFLSGITTAEKKSPHILRHSFATHLSNFGADLNAIKELLGHANLSATQIYTHNSIDKLRKAYQGAHPRS